MRIYGIALLVALGMFALAQGSEPLAETHSRAKVLLNLSSKAIQELHKMFGPEVDLLDRKERLRKLGSDNEIVALSAADQQIISDIKKQTRTSSANLNVSSWLDVNQNEGVADYLYNGDIMLTEEQLSALEKGHGETTLGRIWNDNTVNYFLDQNLWGENRESAKMAIKYITSHTCINFVNNRNTLTRLEVINGTGCWSYLGMAGIEQPLSLGNGCQGMGNAVHLFMHALGVHHTQTRLDRDQFVILDRANIEAEQENNFEIPMNRGPSDTPYEYGSVMHYKDTAFAMGGKGRTIYTKDKAYQDTIGSGVVSFYDMKALNQMYGCIGKCADIQCKNGGYTNPSNCSVCNCPLGYGGALCDERPDDSGQTLKAEFYPKNETFTVASTGDLISYFFSTHWITAPADKTVEVKVTQISPINYYSGCLNTGIEIKTNDQMLVNPRVCTNDQLNVVFKSSLHPTPIIAYNIGSNVTITIEYKYV